MTLLVEAPFNLRPGDVIEARVEAFNVIGTSLSSGFDGLAELTAGAPWLFEYEEARDRKQIGIEWYYNNYRVGTDDGYEYEMTKLDDNLSPIQNTEKVERTSDNVSLYQVF